MYHPINRTAYTIDFVISVTEHWLEGEIAQWVLDIDAPFY